MPNCLTISTTCYTCLVCNAGYALNNGSCILSNCLKIVNNLCTSCYAGFTLTSTGICLIFPSSCATYDNTNLVCLTCATGYTLTVLGTCLWLPFCKSYDVQTGVCTQCLPNFVYNNQSTQCESAYCSQFNMQQPQIGRVCVLCQPGCTF